MKKLSLNSTKTDGVVELETREGYGLYCNFCGEDAETAVKGSVPCRFYHDEYEELKDYRPVSKAALSKHGQWYLARDISTVDTLFGKRYLKATGSTKWGALVSSSDIEHCTIYKKTYKESVKEVHADICYDCIRQLASLIKGRK